MISSPRTPPVPAAYRREKANLSSDAFPNRPSAAAPRGSDMPASVDGRRSVGGGGVRAHQGILEKLPGSGFERRPASSVPAVRIPGAGGHRRPVAGRWTGATGSGVGRGFRGVWHGLPHLGSGDPPGGVGAFGGRGPLSRLSDIGAVRAAR
ncbi:hypothetical protein Psuf_080420 [Phytohabitans suffuscus]|uniref:Uncharacterized protein n=1 Tax=Phytohabitans suffuscus TaxID=624315 RepID=A0A6F8YXB4_9ACTN|nr:hypothetical protein Psuf_080420 [Phytohabitans suffuscus]